MNLNVELVHEWCPNCAINFAVPKEFQRNRIDDNKSFSCPNGHGISYIVLEVERERKARIAAQEDARKCRERLDKVFLELAYAKRTSKGLRTKLRNARSK